MVINYMLMVKQLINKKANVEIYVGFFFRGKVWQKLKYYVN